MDLITKAANLLRSGELVAFPTETVYGLGADASNLAAIQKLYEAKGRPSNHPVIVHIADVEALSKWASSVPETAKILAEKFWPGPLTMILPKADHVLHEITGGQNSVGLRMPAHPLALELLRSFGGGVIAPSANKFGRLSPTRAEDVEKEFGDEVALVLDGGACTVGIESTIVDLTGNQPIILRPGMIDPAQIESVIGPVLTREQHAVNATNVTRVSGDLPSHYAPVTPLKLLSSNQIKDLAADREAMNRNAFLTFSLLIQSGNCIVMNSDPHTFARYLYSNLRKLDKLNLSQIIVEEPPQGSDWDGIRDRLQRAAK